MEYIGAEVSHKIRSAIKAKLMELGAYVDEELPDYIMVMVANKRSKAQMDGDLQLFLGSNTSQFTSWLYQVLQKLQEVTIGNLDKKSSKNSSLAKEASAKRKSNTTESDSHRKEKRRKSSEGKKIKKPEVDSSGDSKKDVDSAPTTSAKLSNAEKQARSHVSKEIVSSSKPDNSDNAVSSSVDRKISRKQIVKERIEKTQDPDNLKKNTTKSNMSNGRTKVEEKNYLSRLRAEALRTREERSSTGKSLEVGDAKLSASSKDDNQVKGSGAKTSYVHPSSRTKIVLMHSDDEDDDEDFINIKADAEAEQLLKEELPREGLDTHVGTPEVTQAVADPPEGECTAIKPAAGSQLPTIPLNENLIQKRPFSKESSEDTPPPVSSVTPDAPTSAPSVPVTVSRLPRKRSADSEAEPGESKIVKEDEKHSGTCSSVKDRLGVKKPASACAAKEEAVSSRSSARPASSDKKSIKKEVVEDINVVPKKSVVNSVSSRVVPVRDQARSVHRSRGVESKAVKKEKVEDEEEEYDPSNPAVGTVASIVRVKPRPKIPAALQANKNLILKAVAEAQKSVNSAPIRPEKPSKADRPEKLPFKVEKLKKPIMTHLDSEELPNYRTWQRTSSGLIRRQVHEDNANGINNQLEEDDEMNEENIKPDSTRLVSYGDGNDKIIVKVSTSKSEEDCEYVLYHPRDYGDSPRYEDNNESPRAFIQRVECMLQKRAESTFGTSSEAARTDRSGRPPVGLASRMPRSKTIVSPPLNPQFLVTLDGLDPSMFGPRSAASEKQALLKDECENFEECGKNIENVELSTTVDNDAPKKSKTPIIYKIEPSEDSGEVSTLPKSLERCKYWPSCRLGTKCNFHHPVTPCKTFPKCPFGDKCLYIHPFCKFNSACTRRDCAFVHAAPRPLVSTVPRPTTLAKTISAPICRFFPKCSNPGCKFLHPKACRYGKFCSKQDCNFIHQDLPPVDKLKWTSPFKT